ncbi:MAG: metallophosphoesterase [Nitrososphaerales archaeon]
MQIKVLYKKRAVLFDAGSSSRYLIICDLHIGFEEKFRGSGVRIQSNAESMISEVESIIETDGITDLVINGDIKSGIDRILESEWDNVPKFFSRILKKCRIFVIPGNHDGGLSNLLPEAVHLEDINGMLLSDTLILHGHTRPLIKFKECRRLIMGHIHPIFQKKGSPLSGRPVWAFLRISKKSIFRELLEEQDSNSMIEVILMPAFNLDLASTGYVAETTRAERRVGPLVTELRQSEQGVVITLEGEVIGDTSLLRKVL